jgi:hypothetical protein
MLIQENLRNFCNVFGVLGNYNNKYTQTGKSNFYKNIYSNILNIVQKVTKPTLCIHCKKNGN